MHVRLIFAVSIAAFSLGAAAQTPAAGAPAIAPHTCVKPDYPGRLASETRIKSFNLEFKTYGDCIKKYVADNRAIAEAATAAGNRAVDEYNAYSKELQAKIDANAN
jgi:hypothetical protein